MNFNSFIFLLAFLPVTLIIYWMLRKKGHVSASLWFLTLASVFFYGYEYPEGLVVFLLSLGLNYIFVRMILGMKNKNMAVSLGVAADVLILAFFKYSGLLWPELLNNGLSAPGISFYTFCEIALLVECYRGTIGEITPREYTFLLTFFPKMMQGPIVKPAELLEQNDGALKISWENIYRGLFLLALGLFKKVIVANTLGNAVDFGYNHLEVLHTGEALVVMLSYTLQLYFDFSGYCDMAMAIAGFFGFSLPLNFDSPYHAVDICDFWKRWHISLTKFFTSYLYIPLGGNRKGKIRTYINYLIVFLISGLWHGAGITFIIWGMMHGVMYVIVKIVNGVREKKSNANSFVTILKTFGTFLYVNIAWVFFRAPSLDDAFHLFKDMGQLWFTRFNKDLADCFNIDELWYIIKILHLDGMKYGIYILPTAILGILTAVVLGKKNAVSVARECRINFANTLIISVLLIWSFLSFEGVTTYIYVNF